MYILSKVISISFHELSLEVHVTCEYDSITFYDGSSANSPQLDKYCSDNPGSITFTGSSIFIVFKSDYSNNDGRFSLSWWFVSRGRYYNSQYIVNLHSVT